MKESFRPYRFGVSGQGSGLGCGTAASNKDLPLADRHIALIPQDRFTFVDRRDDRHVALIVQDKFPDVASQSLPEVAEAILNSRRARFWRLTSPVQLFVGLQLMSVYPNIFPGADLVGVVFYCSGGLGIGGEILHTIDKRLPHLK